jgi:thiamine-phosphate pyrophosphorylase
MTISSRSDDSGGTRPLAEQLRIFRVLDANFNRAGEGLRVLEEYVRLILDDQHLSRCSKQLRHDLGRCASSLPQELLAAARDTQHDVGTAIALPDEYQRTDLAGLLLANQKRVEQSLRCLEEFSKLVDPSLPPQLEQLRYRFYTLGHAMHRTKRSLDRLANARLYVLVDGADTEATCMRRAALLVEGGIDLLQLRDKELNDRTLLARARALRRLTRGTSTLLIVNDRPDIAALADADGVHVGQEELPVADARKIVGPALLIGVSTHTIEQARQAVLDGADYLGCGPTFPSPTKSFTDFPGLAFLREVASEIRLPAFAIGGITPDHTADVLATGFTRIAIQGALEQTDDPLRIVQSLQAMLGAEGGEGV